MDRLRWEEERERGREEGRKERYEIMREVMIEKGERENKNGKSDKERMKRNCGFKEEIDTTKIKFLKPHLEGQELH
jgi:hypothetical protein